ncbi:actin-like ATPase domain-containing protein [Atractiella rhizophila]|nr:actin-like ATPase domain-containing protein [Atractiella rhizophila]
MPKKKATAPAPSAQAPPDSPAIPTVSFKYTTYHVIGYLNAKNVAANFCKTEKQSWWNRRLEGVELERERANKRRRLAGWDEGTETYGNDVTGVENVNGDAEKMEVDLEKQSNVEPGGLLLKGEAVRKPDPKRKRKGKEREEDASGVNGSGPGSGKEEAIVIHPGSRYTRIGRSSDPYPLTIPTVIARRRRGPPAQPTVEEWDPAPFPRSPPSQSQASGDEDGEERPTSPFQEKVNALRADLKAKMRSLKLRGQTNGQGLAKGHNSQVDRIVIQEINDYDRVEWTEGEPGDDGSIETRDVWVGEHALLLARPEQFLVRTPINGGGFNTTNYTSSAELMGDLEMFFLEILRENWEIEKEDLGDYSVILVVPDLNDQAYIVEMTDLLLRTLGFSQIILQQESLCAAFGAGLTTACVVDVGAKKTSISCVEEGLVLPETRNCLAFGGDDITELFLKLLIKLEFPYKNVDLNRAYDWKMLEGLKEQVCTLSETGYGLNLFEFSVRKFGRPTEKYQLKVYEDAYIAPLALFNPRIIDFERKFERQFKRPKLWLCDKEYTDDMYDMGFNAETASMRLCTRHLLPSIPAAFPISATNGHSEMVDGGGDVAMNGGGGYETLIPAALQGHLQIPSAVGTPGGSTPGRGASPAPSLGQGPDTQLNGFAGRRGFDVVKEASKVPLDVAITECIAAAGISEERAKRLASTILVVGGGVKVNGFSNALTARLNPLLQARYAGLTSVGVIPPPREIDPCILAWKGVSVLNQLESAKELWALRERSLFL